MGPLEVPTLGGGGGLSFIDEFNRADTAAGDLGTSTSGTPWTLYGGYVASYPLPAATDGQISSGGFVDVGGTVVYATARLPHTARHLECTWSWVDDTVGTDFTTLAMVISPSANIIDTMLHVTITNGVAKVQKRLSGGAFVDLAPAAVQTISPSLALANTRHTARVDVQGNQVRLNIDGRYQVVVQDGDVPRIIGPYIAVEHFSNTTAVRWPMTIWRVAAGPQPIGWG